MKRTYSIFLVLLAIFIFSSLGLNAFEISGDFIGNDKRAKLLYAWASPTDKWENEDSFVVVLSEKSPDNSKKPDFDAFFGKLGHAIVVSITKSGDIFSTQICHQSLESKNFSTSGTIDLNNFKLENDSISGHLTSNGIQTFFDDKWEVNLNFKVSLSE